MNYTINFGAIKDSVLRFSAQKLITEQKENKILSVFLSEVKSKPMLKIEYLIYRNLCENYFKKTNSDNSISPIDDEWTKVDQII